jgi:transcription elongation factor GreA
MKNRPRMWTVVSTRRSGVCYSIMTTGAKEVATAPQVSLLAAFASSYAPTSLAAMTETVLSRTAYERLRAELDDLTTRGRVDIARKIEEARALGDLSENGDYHAAKDSQGHMETRIRQLEHLLRNSTVSDEVVDNGRVASGSVVTLRYEGDDTDERWLVGSVEERHQELGVISTASPLGQALLGKQAGDEVTYQVPSGSSLKVIVVAVGA